MRVRQVLLALVFAALSLPSYAQFTYATISVPGATLTEARGLNVNGEVAGFYETVNCTNYDRLVPDCPTKGFKLVNGSYIKLMVPGSLTTAIMGLNDYGDLVGFYSKAQTGCPEPVYHGFVWYHTNVVKTIDAPGTAICTSGAGNPVTVPFGINKAGTVVGGIWGISPGSASFPSGGWVWTNGTFSVMDPEASANDGPCCWSVNGIANIGYISGSLFEGDFFTAWFKNAHDEDFYKFSSPNFVNGSDTYGTGVDSNADVVGWSFAVGGYFAKHIELNEGASDAIEVMPQQIVVAYPGAQFTYPFSLNDLRWVAGAYTTSSNTTFGFIAKPNF